MLPSTGWHAAHCSGVAAHHRTVVAFVPACARSAVAVLQVTSPCPPLRNKHLTTCLAAAAEEAADPAVVDPLRARRLQRQQRRLARRKSSDSQEALAVEQADTADDDDAEAAASEPESSRKPLSRIAARRQQRRKPVRRVPAAIVPEDNDLDEADEAESDEDVQIDNDWDAVDSQTADVDTSEDADATTEDDEADDSEVPQQLPAAIVEALRPDRKRSTTTSSSESTAGGKQAKQQLGKVLLPVEPVSLYETNNMYQPVLTDEDLEKDPPGHKSGYVAVIGRPNAGKSTLINAIVGQKLSIVTFKPQTTRHRVVGIASAEDYQMILFDTPGIMQEQRSKLDERMMAAVVSSIKAAEVIIAVVDSGDSPQEALSMFQPGPDWSGPPMAVLLNKADLLQQEQVQQLTQWYKENCRAEQVFVGSALSGNDEAVAAIKQWAVNKLPEGPTLYPKSMVSEQPERFFVSEMIREQIFLQYDQEIPYSCQVQIAEFTERPKAKDFIRALILVERESQAPILLGAGGRAIKKLGSAARQQIEEFLGRPVFLELSVQVAPAWRQQQDKLKDFGYFDPLYIT